MATTIAKPPEIALLPNFFNISPWTTVSKWLPRQHSVQSCTGGTVEPPTQYSSGIPPVCPYVLWHN